jgi:hypothetical protein
VLLSLAYRLLSCLFGLLMVLVRSDLSKDAELLMLRHEKPGAAPSAQRSPAMGSCRPALAYGVVAAGEPPPVAADLPGHPGHDPALAP